MTYPFKKEPDRFWHYTLCAFVGLFAVYMLHACWGSQEEMAQRCRARGGTWVYTQSSGSICIQEVPLGD